MKFTLNDNETLILFYNATLLIFTKPMQTSVICSVFSVQIVPYDMGVYFKILYMAETLRSLGFDPIHSTEILENGWLHVWYFRNMIWMYLIWQILPFPCPERSGKSPSWAAELMCSVSGVLIEETKRMRTSNEHVDLRTVTYRLLYPCVKIVLISSLTPIS